MLLKEDKQKNALVMPRTYFFPQLQVQKKKTHHQKTTTKTTNTTFSEKKDNQLPTEIRNLMKTNRPNNKNGETPVSDFTTGLN